MTQQSQPPTTQWSTIIFILPNSFTSFFPILISQQLSTDHSSQNLAASSHAQIKGSTIHYHTKRWIKQELSFCIFPLLKPQDSTQSSGVDLKCYYQSKEWYTGVMWNLWKIHDRNSSETSTYAVTTPFVTSKYILILVEYHIWE